MLDRATAPHKPGGDTLWARAVPVGAALALAAMLLIGWREVTYSSTFQLFGDYIARLDVPEKVVALTFDDGPHPVNTGRILDLLDRHRIKATFFMMGANLERFPDVARSVAARGHQLGNHSYSHPKMIWMSPAAIRDEIERTDTLLERAGATLPIPFRAPHSVKFVMLPYVLQQTGRLSVLADVDPKEWKRRPADVMTPAVLAQVRPGSILGFHDPAGLQTERTVDAVVTELVRQGYRFATISELVRLRH